MEYLFIYLLQVAKLINLLSVVFFVILCVLLIISLAVKAEDVWQEKWNKPFKQSLIILITLCLLCAFFPSKNTLLLIGGTYLGKRIISTEKMQKIDEIINLQLDKYIKELKGE